MSKKQKWESTQLKKKKKGKGNLKKKKEIFRLPAKVVKSLQYSMGGEIWLEIRSTEMGVPTKEAKSDSILIKNGKVFIAGGMRIVVNQTQQEVYLTLSAEKIEMILRILGIV